MNEKGIAENTVVFFCSDNGQADPQSKAGIASAGPFRGHKHQMWEGGLRVPSLIEWPGKIEGDQTTNYQSGTVDYLPSILDMIDIPVPDKVPIDGISLLPMLNGKSSKRNVPIAAGYQRLYNNIELYAFIDGQYKICIPDKGENMMLFNIEEDPTESNNLAQKNPELLKQLEDRLEKVKKTWKDSREGKDYQ